MEVNQVSFTYRHPRAAKARLAKTLAGPLIVSLILLAITFVLGGAALLVTGYPIGWFTMSLSALPLVVFLWYKHDLKVLHPSRGTDVSDVLEGDILGYLSKNPTPKEIATIVGSARSGRFFGARYGITKGFLENIASEDQATVSNIWSGAMAVRNETEQTQITGGALVAALLSEFPQRDALLAHIHLDYNEVLEGIRWYAHIHQLVERHSKPRRTGGIGRDWAFGYIPLLRRFGTNLSEQAGGGMTVDIPSHINAVNQLVEMLGSNGRRNAALIGQTGAGKTTIIHAFADTLMDATVQIPRSLKFRQVFLLDSSALIAAAPGRGELEGLIMQVLGEAYKAKNIIICLDNAQLFFEEGVGSVDLTNVLQPILDAGNLQIILTMDEQRLLQIGQRNPSLINSLNRITVSPASKEETMDVMREQLILTEYQKKVTYMHQSLSEAYRLSERYVHDLVMPGRAVKLMETAASYAEGGLVTAASVQTAIERTLDVKVSVASDEDEREKLLNLETLIHQRMINQTRAVGVVSDALRRARAGVRNQDRPIGTFLFLGPTGVGKTELAKALADVYFGGEDRIIRLDLNEYVGIDDVARLIADGAQDPHSLTAQAMKQPFSVILLDEIEKAHPNVLTTLLQLLDEGILRDINNREVSFRDAIVIATSNAGADRIREYISGGYDLEQFESKFIDELIDSNQFKPEFLNRFDEIVTFRPLTKDELVQVIDLILAGINKTLALQKVAVNVAEDAKLYLVDQGYDPRLGARPMRRVVQRAVENTVAKAMLGGSVVPGSTIEITLDQVQAALHASASGGVQ